MTSSGCEDWVFSLHKRQSERGGGGGGRAGTRAVPGQPASLIRELMGRNSLNRIICFSRRGGGFMGRARLHRGLTR